MEKKSTAKLSVEGQERRMAADTIVEQSEHRMGTMALIARKQVKLWKAMLIGFFFTGFVSALVFAVALGYSASIYADNRAVFTRALNIAPTATIKANSFAMKGQDGTDGWKLINDNDTSTESVKMRASMGEPLSVDIVFSGNESQIMKGVSIAIDPEYPSCTACGVKDFTIQSSLDGVKFNDVMVGMKSNTTGFEEFPFPSQVKAKVLRLVLRTNHGNPNWFTLKEVRVMQ